MPEIAPEVTDLIDPLDFISWYRAITGYILNPTLLNARQEQIKSYKAVSWKQSGIWLRDILLKISGQSRPLPALRMGKPLLFDDTGAKGERTMPYKLGGWYAPEKRGTWTAGNVATLQGELRGVGKGPLLLELAGSAFTSETHPTQQAEVTLNGTSIGEIRWSGAVLSDLLLVPADLVDVVRTTGELLLSLRIQEPMSPESIDPKSTDKRLLGLRLVSACFHEMQPLKPDAWTEYRDRSLAGASDASPLKCHGSESGASYKLPLLLPPVESLSNGRQLEHTYFLGIRLLVKGKKEARLAFIVSGQLLSETFARPGKMETRFVAITGQPNHGALLEIACSGPSITDVEIMEHGLFSEIPDQALAKGRIRSILDCTESSGNNDLPLAPGSATSWTLDKATVVQKGETQLAFVSGWSRFERSGVWTISNAAFVGLDCGTALKSTVFLAFRIRPYKASHADIIVNGRPSHRWNFYSRDLSIYYLPIPLDETRGRLKIEFRVVDPASPSEMEGSADTRRLGFLVSSIAILDLPTVISATARPAVPELANKSIYSLTAPGKAPTKKAEHWKISDALVLERDMSLPVLLSGWSKPETSGVWTDGYTSMLLFKSPPKLKPGHRGVISFELKPFLPTDVQVRVNNSNWIVWKLPSSAVQQHAIEIGDGDTDSAFLLIGIRPQTVASPEQTGARADKRLLGLFLSSISFNEVEKAERQTVAAPVIAPIKEVSSSAGRSVASTTGSGAHDAQPQQAKTETTRKQSKRSTGDVGASANVEKSVATSETEKASDAQELTFDLKRAKSLQGGSFIVEGKDEAVSKWIILSSTGQDLGDGKTKFQFKAAIDNDLEESKFVEEAYMCILTRRPDENGKAHYESLIASGKFSRPGVLSILASSKEAQTRASPLLIIPGGKDGYVKHGVEASIPKQSRYLLAQA